MIKPKNLLAALAEGVLGYMIYQARCGLSEAYSEYLLYDPIVRICKDKNWKVKSEYKVDNRVGQGDKKRIDFLCSHKKDANYQIGLEVKYLKDPDQKVYIEKDVSKLRQLKEFTKFDRLKGFIIIAGNHSTKNCSYIDKLIDEFELEKFYSISLMNQFKKNYGVTVLKVFEEND